MGPFIKIFRKYFLFRPCYGSFYYWREFYYSRTLANPLESCILASKKAFFCFNAKQGKYRTLLVFKSLPVKLVFFATS